MRREGFELSVSPPRVVYKEEGGKRLEPLEEVICEVDDEQMGSVIEVQQCTITRAFAAPLRDQHIWRDMSCATAKCYKVQARHTLGSACNAQERCLPESHTGAGPGAEEGRAEGDGAAECGGQAAPGV